MKKVNFISVAHVLPFPLLKRQVTFKVTFLITKLKLKFSFRNGNKLTTQLFLIG